MGYILDKALSDYQEAFQRNNKKADEIIVEIAKQGFQENCVYAQGLAVVLSQKCLMNEMILDLYTLMRGTIQCKREHS